MGGSAATARALEAALGEIASQKDAMVDLLRELVEINSHSGNLLGIARVGNLLYETLRSLPGLSCWMVEVDAAGKPPQQGPHLVATTTCEGPRVLLSNNG